MESAVYLGVDIGKSGHYALAVDAAGKPIYQTSAVNGELALRKLVDWAKQRQATVVVDQPWSGGLAAEAVLPIGSANWLFARPDDSARTRFLCWREQDRSQGRLRTRGRRGAWRGLSGLPESSSRGSRSPDSRWRDLRVFLTTSRLLTWAGRIFRSGS